MGDRLVILKIKDKKSLIIELLVSIERDKMIVIIMLFIGLLTEIKSRFNRFNLIIKK